MNLSTSFRELPFSVEMLALWLKYMYSILCALTCRPMPAASLSRLCSRFSVFLCALTCRPIPAAARSRLCSRFSVFLCSLTWRPIPAAARFRLCSRFSVFLCALIWRHRPPATRSRLCSRFSAWVRAFARSAMSSVLVFPVNSFDQKGLYTVKFNPSINQSI